jgi:hypothetical protein
MALMLAACGTSVSPTPIGGDPLTVGSGSSGDFVDALQPGMAMGWTLFVENTSGQDAVIDGYEFPGKSRSLDVVGATATLGPVGRVIMDASGLAATVKNRPLVGASLGPAGPSARHDVVFVFRAPSVGDYGLDSVLLKYHIGSQAFTTEFRSSLELCVGATVPAGSSCPFPREPAA